MYPPDSVVHPLKPGPGVDQLPCDSTVMSPKIIFGKICFPNPEQTVEYRLSTG